MSGYRQTEDLEVRVRLVRERRRSRRAGSDLDKEYTMAEVEMVLSTTPKCVTRTISCALLPEQ